jgi:hypothetical protein
MGERETPANREVQAGVPGRSPGEVQGKTLGSISRSGLPSKYRPRHRGFFVLTYRQAPTTGARTRRRHTFNRVMRDMIRDQPRAEP